MQGKPIRHWRLPWSGTALALAAGMTWAGCGGSSNTPSSPTTPTPTPTTNACSVISGGPGGLAILNGSECPTSNTSVVLLNLRDSTGQAVGQCTGTVIGARAVLTAAHCLDGDTGVVRIFRGTGEQITASSFQVHPRYSGSGGPAYDVAVVLTSEDLGRVPIPLLLSRDPQVGETAVVGGWGLDQNGNGTILRAGLNTVSGVSSLYFETEYSATTATVCYGDSGGSLMLSAGGSWAVAGVTSETSASGYNCANSTSYFANVRHADVRSFIFGLVPDAAPR
jgi:secreted trypsin-like serine protease